MATDLTTQRGAPVAGWALRADRAVFDVGAMIEEYGQVFRHPVVAGPRADEMAPGQPCFLFVTDTSRVVGIGAIGEVVAPVLVAPVDLDDPDGAEQSYAEVELLPLRRWLATRRSSMPSPRSWSRSRRSTSTTEEPVELERPVDCSVAQGGHG